MRNYEKSVKMTCAENPPPSLLKQDGLCTQGLYCRNQSWEIETGGGVCENVSASWFDRCMKKGWRRKAEKKLPLDWKMATLNFGFSFGMCTLTHAWALCEVQIRKPKLKKRTLCRGFHSITTQNCGNPSQMLLLLKRWTEKENNKIAMRIKC